MSKGEFHRNLCDTNVLPEDSNNVPDSVIGLHRYGKRQYIRLSSLIDFAASRAVRGITYIDLMNNFNCSKRKAQRKLKNAVENKLFFTAKSLRSEGISLPTLRDRNPQKYYSSSKKADIVHYFKQQYRNVLLEPTGTQINDPSIHEIQKAQADTLFQALQLLPQKSPFLHKIQLMFKIDKNIYNDLDTVMIHKNKAKIYEERIKNRLVKYAYYPNGTVVIYIESNKSPFRLEEDNDVSMIFCFLGQVRDRFLFHIYDRFDELTSPVSEWVLKGCDVNKDIEITSWAQITSLDIQLKYADRVFRIYVKSSSNKASQRIEESLCPNMKIPDALNAIRNPRTS